MPWDSHPILLVLVSPVDPLPGAVCKAPREEPGAGMVVGEEAQQGTPPQGTSDGVSYVSPLLGSAGGAMDGAGCGLGEPQQGHSWARAGAWSGMLC